MPQIFQVLKCYKCSVFQIHQTKKSNKFECKVCGEKQSIKRHYGIGTGKDCRVHVQKLNALRGTMDKEPVKSDSDEEYEGRKVDEKINENIENSGANHVKLSKWAAFIDKEKLVQATEEPMFLGDKEVFLELPQKKKTKKYKVKANITNSEDYLQDSNNVKGELKANAVMKFSNENNIDDFENEKISIPDIDNGIKLTTPVVLEEINKNSKWAQFVNTQDHIDSHSMVLPKNYSNECVLNSDNLFSLCDDNDLDQVLDI